MPVKTRPGAAGGGNRTDRAIAGRRSRSCNTSSSTAPALGAPLLQGLGARVVYELLDEVGRHNGIGDDIDRHLERYVGLNANELGVLGADRFAASPIRKVPQ